MISLTEACVLAQAYFKKNTGSEGISNILQGIDCYIISSGLYGQRQVGGLIIVISMQDGSIRPLRLPSKEGFALTKTAQKIDVPQAFRRYAE